MPSASNVIGTVLTMDTQSFVVGAQEARKLIRELTKEFDASEAGMGRWQKSIQGVGKRMEFLEAKIKVEEALIKDYKAQIESLSQDYAKNKSRIEDLEQGIVNARVEINRYTKQLEDCQEQLDTMWMAAEDANTPLRKLTNTIETQEKELADLILRYKNLKLASGDNTNEIFELENRISSLNDELRENRSILAQIDGSADALTNLQSGMPKGFTVAGGFLANMASNAVYDAVHRIGEAIKDAVEVTIEWESAFTGVRRTVEGTEEDYIKLESQLRGMSTTVATSLSGIADIATLAGQMGIPIDQISEFTRVMIMLGDTTNITAEEAGDSLARLANLLNLSTDDFERMGSAIVDLGNKFPTTESEIAAMASRLGGTANMLGITADEVLGIANAISAVGLEAEMGGNAVSKTLREMQLAVENGTANLATFASTAGMTVDEFAELFSEDATGALQAFVNGLGDTSRNGRSVTQILKLLNITELRQVDTLSRLATNTDTFNDSLAVAKSAWNDNMALAVEANKRYETLESRLQMMKNAWSNVAIEVMDNLNPVFRKAIDFATGLARSITGQKGASEQLDVAITNLRSATEEFRKAQDEAKDSTDALTLAMVQLRKEQQKQSYISFAKMYQDSATEAKKAEEELTEARDALVGLFTGSQRFQSPSGKVYADILQGYGFDVEDTSTDNILSMYSRLDEIERKANGTEWFTLRNDTQSAFYNLYKVLSNVGDEIERYEQALKNMDIKSEEVWENQEIALRAYANLFETGDISVADLVGNVDEEIIEVFKNLEEGWTRGTKSAQAYLKTINDKEGLESFQSSLNEELKGLDLTSDGYWGVMASLEAIYDRAKELGIELTTDSKTLQEAVANLAGTAEVSSQSIWNEIWRGVALSKENALALGQDYGESDIVNALAQGRSDISSYRRGIEDRLREALATDATNSPLIEYLEDELERSKAIQEQIERSYNEHYAKMMIEETKSADQIKADFQAQRRLENQINALLGIPVEREDVNGAIAAQVRENAETAYRYRTMAEEESNEKYKQFLLEEAEDLDSWNKELAEVYQLELTPIEGQKDEPEEKKGDWFTRWFNSSQTEEMEEFAQGLQSMVSQIAEIWDSIGGGILDVINGWYDAQISAIDKESEHLQERLEENLDMIEQNRAIQENTLRKQLEEGVIDEETYYRQSAKNKYESEAQKQQAQKETADAEELLQEKRQALEQKQFNADKMNSIASILISTAQAIAAAYGVNPIYGAVMTGILSAIGAAQVATVAAQQYTPALATGGIVSAPTTALIGEAGKEAVLPLEQNTDWMDELAYRIGSIVTSDRINTAIDRTLNEDGRTVDKTSNMQFTQIINSPKALSRKEIYRDTRRLVRMVDRRTS